MSKHLLDVNVLLALMDEDHVEHARAHAWAGAGLGAGWATCALTENAFVRIFSQPAYPNPVPVAEAVDVLTQATSHAHHTFWPCDLSLTDDVVDTSRLLGHRQITDAYLLALAVRHRGALVTLDGKLDLATVRTATADHLVHI